MGYDLGRLIDHLDVRVRDFPAARRFYGAVFEALGRGGDIEDGDGWMCVDELYVSALKEGGIGPTQVHLCFQAADRDMVTRFHAAGLEAGGRDNGGPGLRDYHPGYYAAFLLDPEGNNIEAKADERATSRSAGSVRVETD